MVTPTLASVRNGRSGCRHCGKRRAAESHKIAEADAIQQMMKLNATPLDPYPGSHYPWKCRCDICGAVNTPRLRDARRWKSACKSCGYRRTAKKIMISEATAIELMKAAGATPIDPYPGSMRKWKCSCDRCGKTVSPLLNSIQKGQGPCSYCAVEVGAETRRLPAVEAIKTMQEIGEATPLEPYPGSMRIWRCRCNKCGNEITPRLAQVRNRNGHACKFCAEYGFDRKAPAVLYVVEHPQFESLKVGVMNESSSRLKHFARSGWMVVDTYSIASGAVAEEIEDRIFAKLKSAGIDRGFVPSELMPYSGHSETIAMGDISKKDLRTPVRGEVSCSIELRSESSEDVRD